MLSGEYKDEVFITTKFARFNNWFSFWLFIITIIRWITLMFNEKESQTAIYLGEWSDWFGPKAVTNTMLVIQPINSLILFFVFYLAAKNPKKLLLWLDFMQFDNDSRCFTKMDLNQVDSQKYIKQFALPRLIVKHICYSVTYSSMIILIVSLYYFENRHHFFYGISFIFFCTTMFYYSNH